MTCKLFQTCVESLSPVFCRRHQPLYWLLVSRSLSCKLPFLLITLSLTLPSLPPRKAFPLLKPQMEMLSWRAIWHHQLSNFQSAIIAISTKHAFASGHTWEDESTRNKSQNREKVIIIAHDWPLLALASGKTLIYDGNRSEAGRHHCSIVSKSI